MVTPPLVGCPGFAPTYALLEEFAAAGGDYGLSGPTRRLLSQAFVELTDSGMDMPDVSPVPDRLTDASRGFDTLHGLLSQMLAEATDLTTTLRLIRVRDLVTEARASR